MSPTVMYVSVFVFMLGLTGFLLRFDELRNILTNIAGTVIAAWCTGRVMLSKWILYNCASRDNPGTYDDDSFPM